MLEPFDIRALFGTIERRIAENRPVSDRSVALSDRLGGKGDGAQELHRDVAVVAI
jgi:hypothetical protein